MELLERLTDDQKAVLGGMAALFLSGTIMSASYYLGRWARAKQARARALERSAQIGTASDARARTAIRKAA
jgi:hypothetical protein